MTTTMTATTPALTRAEKRILAIHGNSICAEAYASNHEGNGTSTIRWTVVGSHVPFRTVDSMINIGRKLAANTVTDPTLPQ